MGLALNLGRTWLYQHLWVGLAGILFVHVGWGLIQTIGFLFLISRRRDALLAFVAMLVALAGFFFGSPQLSLLGDRAAFVFLRPAYDRAIAQASPGLVVFPWAEGIPDGGSAIVYDPSDDVAKVTIRNADQVSPRLAGLLNGTPIGCDRLAPPHYFRCYFG